MAQEQSLTVDEAVEAASDHSATLMRYCSRALARAPGEPQGDLLS